ncbi:MAG: helix-turn-helix domain-containing protein [Nocardioides sp.]
MKGFSHVVSSHSQGPGGRPMTAKRRRFLELLAQGSSLAGACREVGVSRSTGHIWMERHGRTPQGWHGQDRAPRSRRCGPSASRSRTLRRNSAEYPGRPI